MSAWVTIPCLLALRDEFNALSPSRDKGADGTIGDTAHTSSSDHTPDEDSDVLRSKDADTKNEVHALDIDSSGPWPGSSTTTQKQRFHAIVMGIIAREKARWLDPNDTCRLEYVIWDGKIYSRSRDFAGVTYTGDDQHTNHGHFSARYLTAAENDTSPWGVEPKEFFDVIFQDKADYTAYMVSLLRTQVPAAIIDMANNPAQRPILVDLMKDGARDMYFNALNAKRAQVVTLGLDGTTTTEYVTGRDAGYDAADADLKKEMRNAFDALVLLGIALPNTAITAAP